MLPSTIFASQPLKIITSIRPLKSIIANLTKDVDNNIELIIDHNESLHNYHLKPTKIHALHNSDIIIIIDSNFEIFLSKILSNLGNKKIIEIAKLPGIKLQKNDEDHHHHHHDEGEEHEHHHHANDYDYHLWLDIDNVKIASKELVKILSEIDPSHKPKYEANLEEFSAKLSVLDNNIQVKLLPIKEESFIVTHNAYQYFINRYGLKTPQSITIDHDHNIGAKTFLDLQDSIKKNKVKCIFEEPQFESHIMLKLKENSNINIGKLDAEWGPNDVSIEDAYFSMMNNLSSSLVQCLK